MNKTVRLSNQNFLWNFIESFAMLELAYNSALRKVNMNILFKLLDIFNLGKERQFTQDELDKVIRYTKSIVVREDLIKQIVDKFNKTSSDDPDVRLNNSIQTYLMLEDFIVKNKPLVIQKAYTKESLHEEIRKTFDLQKLPIQFRLIFLPEKEQLFLLYISYTKVLVNYIVTQVGIEELQKILTPITAKTPFSGVDITNENEITNLYQHLPDIKTNELTQLFKKINEALYQHISVSFGVSMPFQLTLNCYQRIKETYAYYLIARFLQTVPQGILDRERVAYMTREDLEKQAMKATTEEKMRRELAEKLAKSLQDENKIIEEKVKEQTFEINQEKEKLKIAIEKVNINFLQAKRNEAKLTASVKGLPLGFILTDTKNSVVTSNNAAKKILSTPHTITSIQDIEIHLKDKNDLAIKIDQCRNRNSSVEFEALTINDQILNIMITAVFLTEPLKEYVGTVILIDDITEEKRLEKTKDEFFVIASHELRTPLTTIQGSTFMLKKYFNNKITDRVIQKFINYIDKSSIRLINIVNEFLNVSRLEQGRIMFNNDVFNLSDLIISVVNDLKSLAEEKKIYLRYDNPLSLPPIFADKERAREIFVNLIGNAIKFTTIGGVSITTEKKDDSIYVRVIDTGTGIANANKKFLFQKFQQTDNNILARDLTKGVGLGLYISKKLAEAMGGTISLEASTENKGSTFTFSLPIAKKGQGLTAKSTKFDSGP